MPVSAPSGYDIVAARSSSDYFVTAGTLPLHAASYIKRQADDDLYQAVRSGEYAYVLNTRQMGKSSLMVRTVARLRQEGFTVAVLDLTAIGLNLTVEQWYNGLLLSLSEQLNCEDEIEDWWEDNDNLGPMQRFFGAIRQVLLQNITGTLIVFIDEIDAVRSLPFSTDEFFAGIRACFNGRNTEEALVRLTFSLIGSATPAELVSAPQLSPFNIGRRIELTDFALHEAAPLATAMGANGQALLAQALHWTGGHPYLTQRLCRELAISKVTTTREVDALCRDLFLHPSSTDRDDNLAFVRNRLLKEPDHSKEALLHLYGQILQRKSIRDDDSSPLCAVLKLSGIAKVPPGGRYLIVRNRIYERVFNLDWVEENTSSDEIHRQRMAADRARNQTLIYTGGIVLLLLLLLSISIYFYTRANSDRNMAIGTAYAANINLAHEELKKNPTKARELLRDASPANRGLEWNLLDSQCAVEEVRPSRHSGAILSVAVTSDGSHAVTTGNDSAAYFWDLDRPNNPPRRFSRAHFNMTTAAFSPDDKLIAVGGKDHEIRLFDGQSQQPVTHFRHTAGVTCLTFMPDGRSLLSGDDTGNLHLWDIASRTETRLPAVHGGLEITGLALNATGDLLAAVSRTGKVVLYRRLKDRVFITDGYFEAASRRSDLDRVRYSLAFTPDGQRLVVAGFDGSLIVYDIARKRATALPPPGGGEIAQLPRYTSVVVTRDGKTIVVGQENGGIVLYSATSLTYQRPLGNHRDYVTALTVSPKGQRIVSVSRDRTMILWEPEKTPLRQVWQSPLGPNLAVTAISLSQDGRTVATSDLSGMTRFYDRTTGRMRNTLRAAEDPLLTAHCLLPENDRIITADNRGNLLLFDGKTGSCLQTIHQTRENEWRDYSSLVCSPDGKTLFAAQGGNLVEVWSLTTATSQASPPIEGLRKIAITPDGSHLISGGVDRVDLWRIKGQLEHEDFATVNEWGTIHALACSHDGRFFVTGHENGSAVVWSLQSSGEDRMQFPLSGHLGRVKAVAISSDGHRIATASDDGNLRIWDSQTRRELLSLDKSEIGGIPSALSFVAEDNGLLVGCTDGALYLLGNTNEPSKREL